MVNTKTNAAAIFDALYDEIVGKPHHQCKAYRHDKVIFFYHKVRLIDNQVKAELPFLFKNVHQLRNHGCRAENNIAHLDYLQT